MVVLTAGICTKAGKPLLARNFVDISKVRVEGLLAAFPKLLGTGQQDHTFIETESVRYVFQAIESLYLLLITNKASNIVQDLETLQLLAKMIPEYCPSFEEDAVLKNAFELLFAFDEVISLGHKEAVSMNQVKTFMAMESHEEKIQELIRKNKEKDARENARVKAKELDRKMRAQKLRDGMQGQDARPSDAYVLEHGVERRGVEEPYGATAGARAAAGRAGRTGFGPGNAPPPVAGGGFGGGGRRPKAGGGGMQLGRRAPPGGDMARALEEEGVIDEAPAVLGSSAAGSSGASAAHTTSGAPGPTGAAPGAARGPPQHSQVTRKDIHISCDERISVTLNKDGGLEHLEIKGDMSLLLSKAAQDRAQLQVSIEAGENNGFQFKTHPNVNKQAFAKQKLIQLKDPSRPFPIETSLGLLKWRYATTDDESMVPLSINCWPSTETDGSTSVNIEYEAALRPGMELRDVQIMIPVPSATAQRPPVVEHVDGRYQFDARAGMLVWTVDLIDGKSGDGSMEFKVPGIDDTAFFPIGVAFYSTKTLCEMSAVAVLQAGGHSKYDYSSESLLKAEAYSVR